MNLLNRTAAAWKNDNLLRRVVRNSSLLFSSSTLGILLSILTSVFSSRALGVELFGILAAITTFAAVADKLLSFRIGELVVKYTGAALAKGEKEKGAAVFKVAALTEMAVSFLSYGLIVLFAPLAASYFAKDASLAHWFILYGLIVPFGLTYESSTALLQVGGKYKFQAGLNLIQNLSTAGLVLYAFISKQNAFPIIVSAYLAGKAVSGFGYLLYSFREAESMFGPGWFKARLSLLPPAREFWGFAFSSNFSGTMNLLVRDSDVLWVNALLDPIHGGYYKLAVSLIGFMLIPVDPFIKTSFPEITRTVAEKTWGRLRLLLRRLTMISGAITLLFGIGFALIGEWAITVVYGAEFAPAWRPAMLLFLGYGFANTFFWNRPLSLALGEPYYPLIVTFLVGAAKIGLSALLLARYGIALQASLMSAYFVTSITLILVRAFSVIHQMEKQQQADTIQA